MIEQARVDLIPVEEDEDGRAYCRLAIDEFNCGRQILFGVYLRLAAGRYAKVAHRGEDLSPERILAYKKKGVHSLYLRLADFRTYVGLPPVPAPEESDRGPDRERKLKVLARTSRMLQERVRHDGIDPETFEGASVFVQAMIDVLCEDPDMLRVIEALSSQPDTRYAHSVGVSLYGAMIARAVSWFLPTNRFKVAMGGLLHDLGEKELPPELLARPRVSWTADEVRLHESHPERGAEILGGIRGVPLDVIQIVREHHENCLGTGFPSRLKRGGIHPMAKLVTVADEFCERVLRKPDEPGLAPREALERMASECAGMLEPRFFEALTSLFQPKAKPKRRSRSGGVIRPRVTRGAVG